MKLKIMSCRKEINKINRKKYGIFWRLKRRVIALEEINEKLDKVLKFIEKQ